MPVVVACLLPAAPLLLPRLTGDRVPEVAGVREAASAALAALDGLSRLVVVAPSLPGTLAGFGAPPREGDRPAAAGPRRDGSGAAHPSDEPDPPPVGSWPHELAAELLDGAGAPPRRTWASWDEVEDGVPATDPARSGSGTTAAVAAAVQDPAAVGLLLLADGSRTRGVRAPGGDDPRGEVVDGVLLAALREGRAPVLPGTGAVGTGADDAGAVGATAGPAVALLAGTGPLGPGSAEVLYAGAPLGVGYLVAVRRETP
ncbi:hypothetical protein [Aquipuribacter hungaricus]|uniref:Uncharacterized protein n=3 Tax=Aquipuribacter hungaricus TaxID=545624 RepID=A0ABV7WJT5_9MICO